MCMPNNLLVHLSFLRLFTSVNQMKKGKSFSGLIGMRTQLMYHHHVAPHNILEQMIQLYSINALTFFFPPGGCSVLDLAYVQPCRTNKIYKAA